MKNVNKSLELPMINIDGVINLVGSKVLLTIDIAKPTHVGKQMKQVTNLPNEELPSPNIRIIKFLKPEKIEP